MNRHQTRAQVLAAVLLAASLSLAPLAVHGQAAAGQGPAAAAAERVRTDYIVAIVNRELVTAVELAQRLGLLAAEAQRRAGPGARPSEEALRQQALDSLVEERVVLTYARDSGGRVDDADLDRAMQAIAAQNQLTLDGLRERLAAEGIDLPRFRANLRDQLLVERTREREVMARIRISDLEIDEYLQREREAQDRELEIAQIFVPVPEGASSTLAEERRQRAESALARVRAGESFEAVARDVSEDPNRERGGSLGPRLMSRLPELFVQVVRKLKPGEVAPELVRSGAGFHLLKLIARAEPGSERVTQTRVRHILLRPSARLSAQAAAARLSGWQGQIRSGARRFEDTAREFSEDGSAAQGGDLGWATPGMMVPEFEQAMNRVPVGGVSDPVVSRFGVHLIQVLERREVDPDARLQREQARAALREQKFEPAYLEWVRDLRSRAYIEWREPPP
jgi:peptidyl-prolyl cis-trans isomerase SurA